MEDDAIMLVISLFVSLTHCFSPVILFSLSSSSNRPQLHLWLDNLPIFPLGPIVTAGFCSLLSDPESYTSHPMHGGWWRV